MRSPDRIPAAILWHCRMILPKPALLIACSVSLFWLVLVFLDNRWPLWVAGGSVAVMITFSIAASRSARRICREALQHGGQACLHCRFVLEGLPPVAQCPECGAWYDRNDTTRVWRETDAWLNSRRGKS